MTAPWPNDHCKQGGKHTKCPPDYLGWHEWAEKKSRTHEQHPCPACGLLAVWKPKRKAVAS